MKCAENYRNSALKDGLKSQSWTQYLMPLARTSLYYIPERSPDKRLETYHSFIPSFGHIVWNPCRSPRNLQMSQMRQWVSLVAWSWQKDERHGHNMPDLLQTQKNHAEPMIATPLSKWPRQQVTTDLFYHSGKTYIIVVDYYSKFFEIALLKNMMTDNTMNHLTSSVTMAFQNPLSLTMYPNLQLPHFENLPKNGASHTSQVVLTTSRVMVK